MTFGSLLQGHSRDVARGLLGRRLESRIGDTTTVVVLTEVEAYGGASDPASHAYRGRTKRNATMFGSAGGLYVYRSYGIHWCMNVVCGAVGDPQAVLLRGGIAVEGVATMKARRGRSDHLTDGPGKLCEALGVTGDLDGTSVLSGAVRIGERVLFGEVETGGRIGITRGMEAPWRFVLRPG